MSTALITGGHGGIALAIGEELGKSHQVFAPSRAELDVSSREAIDSWFEKNGAPDLLVNAAGVIHAATVVESDVDSWINDIQVNLIAPYLLSRQAIRGGCKCVINIASTAGYAAYKEWSSYCASKAGVITLTKSMAKEGIAAFSISPGATDTKFRNGLGLPSDNLQSPTVLAKLVRAILDGEYSPGDDIFVRRGLLEVR